MTPPTARLAANNNKLSKMIMIVIIQFIQSKPVFFLFYDLIDALFVMVIWFGV